MASTRLKLPLLGKPCGKMRFYSKADVKQQRLLLESLDNIYRPSSPSIAIYFCDKCKAWHVGHIS